jgi:hypothetical protein
MLKAAEASIGHRQQPIATLTISVIKGPHNLNIFGQIEVIGGLGIAVSSNVNVVSDVCRSPSCDPLFGVPSIRRVKIEHIRSLKRKANLRAFVVMKGRA